VEQELLIISGARALLTDLYNKMKNKKYHPVGTVPKYHPVGIVPKYHPVGIVPKYHPVGIVPKYHPVGIVPKYHPVGIVPKYHPVGIVAKSNCKFVERGNTQMNDISLCLLGTPLQ
jgi:hypothetical protein